MRFRADMYGISQHSVMYGIDAVLSENGKNPGPAVRDFDSGMPMSHSPRHFARTQAAGTHVYMAVSAVNNCFHALHIGFPWPVGTPVGVRNFDPERYAFAAEFALCHFSAPPCHWLYLVFLSGLPLSRKGQRFYYYNIMIRRLQGFFSDICRYFFELRFPSAIHICIPPDKIRAGQNHTVYSTIESDTAV